jgi:hypothetical protein
VVRRWLAATLAAAAIALAPRAAAADGAQLIDRVVARFRSVDAAPSAPGHIVFARELAFEARIEAMSLGDGPDTKPSERHIRAALARHITESLLEELPLEPAATPIEIGQRAAQAQRMLEVRVGGTDRLARALGLERISSDELDAMMRRTARASLYLDRMVAPLVEPNDVELKELHASGQTPFSDKPFADVRDELRRWVVARRVGDALDAFYQRARSRIVVTWVKAPAKK